MNALFVISIVSWVGMWFAFHLGHPVGYVIPIIGLAAVVAIALEAPSPQTDTGASEASERQQDRVVSAVERRSAAKARHSTAVGRAA